MVKQEQLARPLSPEYSICEPQPTCSARSGGVRARKPRRTAPTMPELMKLYQYFLIISECVANGHDCFYRGKYTAHIGFATFSCPWHIFEAGNRFYDPKLPPTPTLRPSGRGYYDLSVLLSSKSGLCTILCYSR